MPQKERNLGWPVTLAGTGINLALGVLYTWSVISKSIPAEWGWSEFWRGFPYSVACLVFALMMVPAGRIQDKIGPRWVATMGGIFTGLGLILASRTTNVWLFTLGFGLLAGSGIGLGYASATPPAVKWFPPSKTGMIAGIVVSGFGLASAYISPLANFLIKRLGIQPSLLIFGGAFLVVVILLSQILRNPPPDFKPQAPAAGGGGKAAVASDYGWSDMLKTYQFYVLWVMYVFAAGAGLMIIGKLAKIVEIQAGVKTGFAFVALLAVGNAAGRIVAGMMSDKIGRTRTMLVVFLLQAILIYCLRYIDSSGAFTIVSMLIGFNYGANLSVFPSITKDFYGLKNFGVNYGLVFTAWGVGSIVLTQISGRVYDATLVAAKASGAAQPAGNFNLAYTIAAVLLVVASALTFTMRPPKPRTA